MMFLQPVGRMETQVLTLSGSAVIAATDKTVQNLSKSRVAVEIQAVANDVAIGGKDVTAAAGIVISKGTSKVIPVIRADAIYVIGTGTVTIADYFQG